MYTVSDELEEEYCKDSKGIMRWIRKRIIPSSLSKEKDHKVLKRIMRWIMKIIMPSSLSKEKDCKDSKGTMPYTWGTEDLKYARLFLYLVKEFEVDNPRKKKAVPLRFKGIKGIKGFKEILKKSLPQEAKTSGAWWKNDSTNAQARAWMYAGWRTLSPNVSSAEITFVRGRPLLGPLETKALKELLLHKYNIK